MLSRYGQYFKMSNIGFLVIFPIFISKMALFLIVSPMQNVSEFNSKFAEEIY